MQRQTDGEQNTDVHVVHKRNEPRAMYGSTLEGLTAT